MPWPAAPSFARSTCFVFLCWRDVTARPLRGFPVSAHARAHDLFVRARRDLHSNQLSGSLPRSLGSLTRLTKLCVVVLSVSGLARGTTHALLMCFSSCGRHRPTVAWLPSLGSRAFPRLILARARRKLYSNAFTGSLPLSIASMTQVSLLDLHANAAPIAVPGSVCAQHYNHMSLSGVELACPWPTVSECAGFDISKLSGVLLPWRTCTDRTLDSCYSTLAPCSTSWLLSLSSNSLSGTVPAWLGSFHGLQMLYVPPLCS